MSRHPYHLAAALVLQNDPALSPNELEACLKISGVPLLDDANGVTTPRIDALAALSCGGLSPVGGIAESPAVPETPLVNPDPGADTSLPGVVFWTSFVGVVALSSAGCCSARSFPEACAAAPGQRRRRRQENRQPLGRR